MKNMRSERGAVTLLVLVTILFLTAFLIGSYLLGANQARAQIEMTEQVRSIYAPGDIEAIYNTYFERGVIHIYTVEQLLRVASGDRIRVVNPDRPEETGRYHVFVPDAIYVLMNDLELTRS